MDYKFLYQNRQFFIDKYPESKKFGVVGQSSPPGNPWSSGGTFGDGNKTFIKKLIVIHDMKTVVELGCGEGASTRAMLEALEITDGHLYGCDTINFQQLPHEHQRFHFTQVAAETYFDKAPYPYDLLHIDVSPHTYEQMKYWMFESKYLDRVKIGGFVCLHDVGNSFDDNVWGEDGGDTPGQWTPHRIPVKEFLDTHEDAWGWTFVDSSNRWGMLCLRRIK